MASFYLHARLAAEFLPWSAEGEQKASASSERGAPYGPVDRTLASPETHRDAVQDRWTSLERDASEEVKIYDTPLVACTRISSSASRASTSSATTTPSLAV